MLVLSWNFIPPWTSATWRVIIIADQVTSLQGPSDGNGHSQKHGLGRGDTREIPSRELTYFPKMAFWRWFSELPQVGYVNSLEGNIVVVPSLTIHQVMMLDPRALVHVALTAQFGYPGAKTCFGWSFSFSVPALPRQGFHCWQPRGTKAIGFFGSKILAWMWRFSLDAACHSDANPLGQDIFSLLKMTWRFVWMTNLTWHFFAHQSTRLDASLSSFAWVYQ